MVPAKSIQIIDDSRKIVWDACAAHPLQSWAWGEFRKAMGLNLVRFGLVERNKLTAVWQLTFHNIPHTPWTIGYFPKGPLPRVEMIKELRNIGSEKRTIFIQFEPNVTIHNSKFLNLNSLTSSHHPLFTKYTFVLDLTRSEDELLGNMHGKTRYNIKVARKHGVVVQENNGNEAFERYIALTRETTDRQGFFAHSVTYHRKMWDHMRKADIAHLFTASYHGAIIAAWILFVFKDSVYYPYGASSREHREVMAPTLMLWETARWAKRQGLKYYDLWGSLGPTPNESDPWYGFHRFKQGFGPKLVEYIGSFDLVINPLLYEVYKISDKIRWMILRMRK